MNRVALDLVMLALRQEHERTGDPKYAIKPATIRQWKRRGHLSPGPGYHLGEIAAYLDRRDTTSDLAPAL